MKRLIVLMIVLAVFAGGNVFAAGGYFEKDTALWFKIKTLAKAGKFDEALAKTGEISPAKKETVLNMIAVIAADDFGNYDKAIEIGKTLNEKERREYLWQYIPRSAAIHENYENFVVIATIVGINMLREYYMEIPDLEAISDLEAKLTVYFLSTYRDAAVIFANRGMLEDNLKALKNIPHGTDYYKSAVTATVIELMNGLHKQPKALDGYLASLNYRKIADYSENIVFGGATRYIVAYNASNTNQSNIILLLYDEKDGNKTFLTALFLDEKIKNYLVPR